MSHEAAEAYALGALDEPELSDFEQHLAECADCARTVADYRNLLADADQGPSEPPPVELRENLLAAIASEPQLDAHPRTEYSEGKSSGAEYSGADRSENDDLEAEGQPPATVTPLRPRPTQPRPRRWLTTLAAASAVIAIASTSWGVISANREADLSARQAAQVALLAQPDSTTRSFTIEGQPAAVIYSRHSGESMLIAEQLPPLPDDHEYQLWTMHPTPGGMEVRPNRTFAATSAVQQPIDQLGDAEQVAITVEPTGGSPVPTDPVMGATEL